MSSADNAIERRPGNASPARRASPGPGVALGALGILGFSFSLPATRLAVARSRPVVRRLRPRGGRRPSLAAVYLRATRAPRPTARAGALARDRRPRRRRRLPAVHLARARARRPPPTAPSSSPSCPPRPPCRRAAGGRAAVAAVLARERAPASLAVLVFIAASGAARGARASRDLYLLVAVVLCAVGYAEGGALARELGGAARRSAGRSCSALPVTRRSPRWPRATTGLHAGPTAWLGFAYVSVVSMFLGFFAWYAGLARGGVARVGQVQLAQPVLTLVWSALAARRVRSARSRVAHGARRARLRGGDPARPLSRRIRRHGDLDRGRRQALRRRPSTPSAARRSASTRSPSARPTRCTSTSRPRAPRATATSSRRRCSRVVYCAPAVGPAIFDPEVGHRLRAHGPRRPGVPLGAARRRGRRDHDDGVGQGRSRRARATGFFVFESRPPTRTARRCASAPGRTSCEAAVALTPGDEIPELQVTPDRYLTVRYAGRLGRLQPDPHRRGVRASRSACRAGSCTGCGRWPRSRAPRPRPPADRTRSSA